MTSVEGSGEHRQQPTSGPPPPDPATRVFPGYAAPPVPPTRTVEPLAVAAVILGIASVPLFFLAFLVGFSAVVVGTAALLRLRRRPHRSGRVMAGIGLAAGVMSFPLGIAFLALPDEDTFLDPIAVPYAELNVGDCYQRPSPLDRRIDREIEVASCGAEHDRQAVGALEHPAPAGSPWPGDAAVSAFAAERCQAAFNRFVNLPGEQASLVADNLVPTEATWRDSSRHVVCAVARSDGGRLTGSVTDNSTDLSPGG